MPQKKNLVQKITAYIQQKTKAIKNGENNLPPQKNTYYLLLSTSICLLSCYEPSHKFPLSLKTVLQELA